MFFWLSKVWWLVLAPSHLALLVLLAGVAMQYTRHAHWGRRLSTLAALLLILLGVLPLNVWLMRSLENRYPRPNWPAHVDGVLSLGGGLGAYVVKTRGAPARSESETRLVSTYELARRYPEARIIFTGGDGTLGANGLGDGVAARFFFDQMGLEPARVTYENPSRTTRENFLFSQRIAQPKPGEVWLLATSAYHMPRAMGMAQRLGWKMTPWPTDYVTAANGDGRYYSFTQNLQVSDEAVHEWLGLLAYQLHG